jgi:excisionase family DNA binding protein
MAKEQQETGAEIVAVAGEKQQPAARRKKRVKDIYTPAELADTLGITRRTVYTWIKGETIPAFKVGPKLWAVRAHVVDALKEGRNPWQAEHGFQGALTRKQEQALEAIFDEVFAERQHELEQQQKPVGFAALSAFEREAASKSSNVDSVDRAIPGLGVVELGGEFASHATAFVENKGKKATSKPGKGRRK